MWVSNNPSWTDLHVRRKVFGIECLYLMTAIHKFCCYFHFGTVVDIMSFSIYLVHTWIWRDTWTDLHMRRKVFTTECFYLMSAIYTFCCYLDAVSTWKHTWPDLHASWNLIRTSMVNLSYRCFWATEACYHALSLMWRVIDQGKRHSEEWFHGSELGIWLLGHNWVMWWFTIR